MSPRDCGKCPRQSRINGRLAYERNGEWVYGYLFVTRKGKYNIKWYDNHFGSCKTSEVIPETVSQFIGWFDGHKTKIFENDIVEFIHSNSSSRYLIWWQREGNSLEAIPLDGIEFNGADYWNGNYPNFEYSTFCLMMLDPYGDFRDIKVIGNIHDNPELLEDVKCIG